MICWDEGMSWVLYASFGFIECVSVLLYRCRVNLFLKALSENE